MRDTPEGNRSRFDDQRMKDLPEDGKSRSGEKMDNEDAPGRG
jgi:hypothetical protein